MSEIALSVLAIAAILALVSLVLPLADRLSLPSTVVLALLGMALGLAAFVIGPTTESGEPGLLLDILNGVGSLGLTGEVFLFLFLPPLLFAAGLSIDVRLLLDEFAAVLLLAVIAVVICTLVVGYAIGSVAEVSLVACLLLGATVAATDPAAVIAIFRDLGAPRRLSTLVAGESLFNDAAAIALFSVLLAVLTGDREPSFLGTIFDFGLDFLGGAAFGYLLARLFCTLVEHWDMPATAQISLTVALAYIAYILGERYLLISGVVAVVTASLTFAVYGRSLLNPQTWETLNETWTQLEFWANSLIFVLAAMLATRILPETELADAGLLALLVLAALAARASVLYLLLPGMSSLGLAQRVSLPYRAVILWGGVRGAVTLVLALSISQNPAIPAPEQHLAAELAIVFVLFTLFVNAPTLKPLIRLLGLDRLSRTETALRDRVMALSHSTIIERVESVGRDYGFSQELTAQVAASIPGEGGETALDGAEAAADDEAAVRLSPEARLTVGVQALANREHELCLEHFKAGTISRRMVASILAFADRRIDQVKLSGLAGYEVSTGREIRMPRGLRGALLMHRHLGWEKPLARQLAAHFEAILILQLLVRELIRFTRHSVRPILGKATADALHDALHARLRTIEGASAAIEVQYPSYADALRSQYLSRAALRFEEAEYRLKLEESLINREVFGALMANLRHRRSEIERRPPLRLGSGLVEMLRQVEVFSELDDRRLGQVIKLLRPRLAIPGELVISRGAEGTQMYFIASGQLDVQLINEAVRLGPGDFFGELALLTRQPRMADVVADSYCHLLVLEARDFQRLLRASPEIRKSIERVADQRLGRGRGDRGSGASAEPPAAE